MKNLLLVATAMLFLVSCGSDDPTLRERQQNQIKKLSQHTWIPTSVLRDNVDVLDEYASFELQFQPETYTTIAGDLSWPAEGTWMFSENSLTEIIRDGEVLIMIELSTDGMELMLTFTIDESEYNGGRVGSLEGEYEFQLVVKQ